MAMKTSQAQTATGTKLDRVHSEFFVTDNGVDIEGITVTVSGAVDALGNTQLLQIAPAAASRIRYRHLEPDCGN